VFVFHVELVAVREVFEFIFEFVTDATYTKNPTNPPPHTKARTPKIPTTQSQVLDDLFLGCTE